MVRPSAERVEKWDKALDGQALSERIRNLKPQMLRNFSSITPLLVEVEDRTKAVLDEEGISTTQYPFYLAFARQCFKLRRKFSGSTLLQRVNIVLQRWVADGFTQAILLRIRDVVFTIPLPGP